METQINLKHEFGRGITPERFMDGMETRTMALSGIPDTKARFADIYEGFAWPDDGASRSFFEEMRDKHDLCVFLLCTDWCPDVIWNVPVLLRVMEQAGIPVEVLPMEAHPDTMDCFLTDGGRAQPIAAFVQRDGEVLGRWGARPAYIQAVMDRFKRECPDKQAPAYRESLDRAYREIGELYNEGDGYQAAIVQELEALIRGFGARVWRAEDEK
ncbi:thioredoxin family protein [Cohnella sp. JJ-181]|uniref:thioredoxin family protein n=1 Tax=Cohnella rhizoplanae TaxID=2974897 RepID=UPI0022FF9149|nr:thioredoxin family protein [Cohnella sp. JJ-181]CAI6015633.1 hypothetical protein COHCIP112018_00093 [Cohnella sp. JJ-181]